MSERGGGRGDVMGQVGDEREFLSGGGENWDVNKGGRYVVMENMSTHLVCVEVLCVYILHTSFVLCLSQIHPVNPPAESPYATVNKLKKKSRENDMDVSACSHQGFLFKRERFQWHKVGG